MTSAFLDSETCCIWISDLLVDFGLILWISDWAWIMDFVGLALPLLLNSVPRLSIAGLNITLPWVRAGTWGINIKGLDYQ